MLSPERRNDLMVIMDQNLDGKTTPAEVDYREAEGPDRKCGVCASFLPPDTCRIVAGKVDENGVCNEFTATQGVTGA